MKIFLVRHGESMQNTKENYKIGLPDHKVILTDKGRKQADKAGKFLLKYLKDNEIDLDNSVMWVSPFERTRETASIINSYLDIKDIREDVTLIEQRYGLFSDKEIDVIKEKYPDQFSFYDIYYQNEGKFYARLPQGEAPFDVALRTKQFIDTIFRDDKDTLIIVTHGAVIKAFLMDWFHKSPEWYAKEKTPKNCAICLINRDGKKSTYEYIYDGE